MAVQGCQERETPPSGSGRLSCLGKAKLEGSREREQKSPATTEKLSRAAMTNCRMCGTDRNRPWSSRKRAGAVLLMRGRESQSESELSFEGQRERAEETASRRQGPVGTGGSEILWLRRVFPPRVQIPVLPLRSYATLGKLLPISDHQDFQA